MICAFLPALGLLAAWLPSMQPGHERPAGAVGVGADAVPSS